jgi:glutamine transport system substrate-binding protein
MSTLYLAQSALLVLGATFAAYFAYQAFDSPPITLGDGPALPKYMTQPTQYRLGLILFVATCLLIYLLIAYFHQSLVPIVGIINPDLKTAMQAAMKDGSLPYPLAVIFSAAIFMGLLKVQKDWNPIFVLRRVVHGWVSIPQIANEFMILMRDELVVPGGARAEVVADPGSPYVTLGDFDKDRLSLDRRWAELCYIRLWLERHRAQGSHFTFFNEPSFAWDQLQAKFADAREWIAPLKQGLVTGQLAGSLLKDAVDKVESLRRQYCRLAACFLVFKNETQKDALRDARQVGVSIPADIKRANPLRYTAIFAAAIVVAIYTGVSLSAIGWDLLHHNTVVIGSEIATRWVFFGLANYGLPIMAVLSMRYLGWRIDHGQPGSYLTSYAAVFLLALGVADVGLTLATMAAGRTGSLDLAQVGSLLFLNIKWGISPAAVSVYVIYHVDRQIDPLLPDIGPYDHWRLPQRLMSCVFFALLVTGFSVLPALGIPASRTAWSLEKLQLVILGTTFSVGLIIAVVGEFLLAPATPPSDRAQPAATASVIGSAPARKWATAGMAAVAVLAGAAAWMLTYGADVPQWAFERKPIYLGERIPLAWHFAPSASTPVYFEVESGAGGKFRRERCVDTDHYHVDRINGTREWRVRAVTDCDSRTPVGRWSRTIEITQYDSVYQRIASRGRISVFVSNSQDQDFFKWGSNQGFDIALTRLIVETLSARTGRALQLDLKPVPWAQLLAAVEDRSADFAISSITRTSRREKEFALKFTDSYYCTGYALIYRFGTEEGKISDIMSGKTIGVQRATTSADLVRKLGTEGGFKIEEYPNNESLQQALSDSKIDAGVTDTAFAQAAQLDMRSAGGTERLLFKEFGASDMPPGQAERAQEYAVAVHRGEVDLLQAINQTLADAKQDDRLARLFRTEAQRYEAAKSYKPGSRNLGERPWECFRETANAN